MSERRLRSAIVVVLSIAITCGCSARHESEGGSESDAKPVVAVRVGSVEVRAFEDLVIAPGQWGSSGEMVLSAPFTALVDSLTPHVGDPVRSGMTYGWLITRESQAAVRGAELLLLQARDGAAREEASRSLRLARRDLVRVPLIAPKDGVVVRRGLEMGSQVAEGGEILAIVPWDAIVFEAHVPVLDVARLRQGQLATIAEAGRSPCPATLQRLLPAASASDQTTLAWLTPRPGEPLPELGRFGTATIVVGPARRAIAVPESALVEDDLTGTTRIAVIGASHRALWLGVTPGVGAEGWREIEAPKLDPGTKVILEGQHGLPDSTLVRMMP